MTTQFLMHRRWPRRARRGFTLVELLVVIIIIITVTAAAVPVLLPVLDSRRVREASRLVSTQFALAQTTALANGRAAGVWIERLPNDRSGAMELYLAEVPPPYAGDTVNSRAMVTQPAANAATATVTFPSGEQWASLIRPGDLIRFNYSGPYYRLGGTETETPVGSGNYTFQSGPASITSTNNAQQNLALPPQAASGGWSTPFQVFRQPVKSASTPLQLPEGTVLDMAFCGAGNNAWRDTSGFLANTKPVVITFNRTGGLDKIIMMNDPPVPISQPIHLLVGKREKLTKDETDTTKQNLVDLDNLWVSINPQSGLVTSSENVANGGTSAADVRTARTIARSAQTMGGR